MDVKEMNVNGWVEAEDYEAPRLEIMEVQVEKGFAISSGGAPYNPSIPW